MSWIYKAAIGVAATLGLLVSGIPSHSTTSAATVIHLQMWHRGNPTPDAIRIWNQTHPNIQVQTTHIPDGEYVTKLAAAIRSGHAPDIVDIDDINGPLFGMTGVLTDLTSRVDALPFKNELAPGQSSVSQVNGKWFTVPYADGASMLLYNKTLFRKAGLDPNKPPTTWAQIKADALKIRALGGDIYGYNIPGACGGCLAFSVSPLIWASGGDMLTAFGPNQKTTMSTSPAVADALAFYRDLWQSGVVAPQDRTQDGSSWDALFYAGKIGIWLGCGCEAQGAEKAGVDVGVAPIPGKNGSFSTYDGGDILGIPQTSSNVNAAWQVIQWLLSPQAQTVMATVPDPVALVPVRLDMATAAFKAKYPVQAITLYAATKGHTPKALAYTAAFEDANAPFLQAEERIVFSNADIHSTLVSADQAASALLSQTWKSTVGS